MRYYPAFLDVNNRLCVVVGGGKVALRKARALCRAGARVRVVAPEVDAALRRMEGVEISKQQYAPGVIQDAFLVVAATDDFDAQMTVAADARRLRVLCNIADGSARSDFIVPATIERECLQVAVATGGTAPALAARARNDIERAIGGEYGEFAALLAGYRKRLRDRKPEERRRAMRRMANSAALELLRGGRREEALRVLDEIAASEARA